ncbi:MAG: hypothetical protein QGI21_01095 [Candidatus Poseidoniaceae archaeon]|jgi:hypothetical protein|nr:hypothetical protein [Candidatus Poseidoniaceae archaeon]
MDGGGLTWISISGILLCLILIIVGRGFGDKNLLKRSFAFGMILCFMDLAVELVGTSIGKWEYGDSNFFINSAVPIELLPIFFSLGFTLTFIHYGLTKLEINMPLDFVFIFMIILGLLVYVLRAINGDRVTLLMISVPLGLWGFSQFSDEKIAAYSLLISIVVGLIDYVIEVIIISSGNYGYSGGYRVETPLTYTMVALAIFGALERYRQSRKVVDSIDEESTTASMDNA